MIYKQKNMANSVVQGLIASQQSHSFVGGNNFIGNLVFWQINETLVMYRDYKDSAALYGIPDKYLVPEKSDKLAFGQACKNAKVPSGYFWDNLKSDNNQILMYGLVKEKSEAGDQTSATKDYKHSFTLYLNRESKIIDISIKDPNAQPEDHQFAADLVMEVNDNFIKYESLTKEEISKTCVAFMRHCGVFLTPSGKTYFVPSKHADLCDRFTKFLAEVSPNSEFIAIPQYESAQASQGFGNAAKDQIDNELRAILEIESETKSIEEGVNEWVHNLLKQGVDAHAKTLNASMADFDRIRNRIDSFSDLLDGSQSKLLESLEKANLCAAAILDVKKGKPVDKYLAALGLAPESPSPNAVAGVADSVDNTTPDDEEDETDF